jgi:hypothetical protein
MNLWTRSGEGSSNARLEEPFRQFLKSATANKETHSRFLNMLSLLEHIGSRKIMLSQMRGDMDKEILKHMAEETRHAFFFKHQAERLAGHALENFDNSNTLCAAEAKMYFGRLDAEIKRILGEKAPSQAAYLWVSFIVELRAAWVYPFYEAALQEARISIPLRSIIAEEEKHLAEMEENLRTLGMMNDIHLARAVAAETKLFMRLLDALMHETTQPQPESASMRTQIG